MHAYVCASMWRLEIDVWCLHFFEIFTVTILCVCVCMGCVHVTDVHYCVCLDHRYTLLCLDYRHTVLCLPGLHTYTTVSSWITDTHFCVRLDCRYTLLCLTLFGSGDPSSISRACEPNVLPMEQAPFLFIGS